MYKIKIQRLDSRTVEDDCALPCVIETCGEAPNIAAAAALAEIWTQEKNVGVVWIEPDVWIN